MKGRKIMMMTVLACLCLLLIAGCGGREAESVRIGSLKGPTSIGILPLMEQAQKGETEFSCEFRMAVGADELLSLMAKEELDIALIPANVAAVLYQRTDGGVAVIDINTLGVLYLVTGAAEISEVSDLKGRTIYLTGKGTTPEASLNYILRQNGLAEGDYALEFKSEAAEVAAVLAEDPEAVGLLPQPFATAAVMQNEALRYAIDLNREWQRIQGGSGMVTGVTVVRSAFLQEHEDVVREFIRAHKASVDAVNSDSAAAAVLAVEAGIVAKEAVAEQAIPLCSLTCVTGEEMKKALSAYLETLVSFDAQLVGGALPDEDFYYYEE